MSGLVVLINESISVYVCAVPWRRSVKAGVIMMGLSSPCEGLV